MAKVQIKSEKLILLGKIFHYSFNFRMYFKTLMTINLNINV